MKSYRKELWFETRSRYSHNGYEDNADAHPKRTIMGREVVVADTNCA